MQNITTKPIAAGVDGCTVQVDKFKSVRMSVTFYLPLEEHRASANALLPFMLTGCGAGFADTRALNRRLAELYGAGLSCSCDKLADSQVLRIGIECIGNKYVPDGSDLVAQCASLLCSLIFDPLTEGDAFESRNFEREKRLALERIDGEINDKRRYARGRCEAEMCAGEPYGLPAIGNRADIEALTPAELYTAWRLMLQTAIVRISVVSDEPSDGIFNLFAQRFADVDRNPAALGCSTHRPSAEVRRADEHMAVNQGKLVMGFSFGMTGGDSESYPMMVFGDLFGGGPYSRLFSNVREKESLCYYCSAAVNRRKGVMLVDSGVEFDNMQRTHDAVLEQFEIMKQGQFTDDELRSSKLSLCDSLRSVYDNGGALSRWYADRVIFDKEPLSPEQVGRLIESVTREQVVEAAKSVRLDTVYRLLGEEAE
ncbi:MAG: insulinase family protein [Firmicutes bacterium]|nr:insulinase family protein [Bacillota bacterium]